MKYTVQSSKYVLKNFFYLLPFALLPAIFLALSTDEGAIVGVLRAVAAGDIGAWSFSALFRAISVLNFATWQSAAFGLVGIVVIVPCVALLMAFLEKHMRIGKRTYNGLLSKLNDNFVSTLVGVVVIVVVYELWSVLVAALLFFVSRIPVVAAAYVFALLVYVLCHVMLMVSISIIYLWLPCMQITGFRTIEALSYSYHLMGQIKGRIIFTQLLVLLFAEGLLCVSAVFIPTNIAFDIIGAILYTGMLMIFCVRMQVVYFDRDHIERADIAKYYQR